jgi:hypothetical protein
MKTRVRWHFMALFLLAACGVPEHEAMAVSARLRRSEIVRSDPTASIRDLNPSAPRWPWCGATATRVALNGSEKEATR